MKKKLRINLTKSIQKPEHDSNQKQSKKILKKESKNEFYQIAFKKKKIIKTNLSIQENKNQNFYFFLEKKKT